MSFHKLHHHKVAHFSRHSRYFLPPMSSFILKKQVDWSLLNQGWTFPLATHDLLRANSDMELAIGEKRNVTIQIDGYSFTAQLINLNFDRQKYPEHRELIQIRYTPKSPIAKYFQTIFEKSFNSISAQKAITAKKHSVTSDTPEFLCLYATDIRDVFVGEAITANDVTQEAPDIKKFSETEWESSINAIDDSASIIKKTCTIKLRRVDKSIADGLKNLYEHRCQICKCSFKNPYDSNLIHAHHIVPFTQSLNNNIDNIMILCPNHHYIVHDMTPEFDPTEVAFRYQNGYKEKLKLNYHLGTAIKKSEKETQLFFNEIK